MVSKAKDVQSFFYRYARDFDSIYGNGSKRSLFQKVIAKFFRQTMFLRFRETLRNTEKPEINTVIDIGCGPGHYCVEFLKQGKTVVGVDVSANMIKIAEDRVKQLDLDGKVEFLHSDYLECKFDYKFDAANLMGFFDYIKDPKRVLLKLQKDVRKEVYMSFPKNRGLLSFQRMIRYKIRKCPLFLYSKKDIFALMHEINLEDSIEIVDCERDFYVKLNLD